MAELNVAIRTDSMRLPLRQSLEQASQLGVRAIELDARSGIHPSQLSDTGLRQLRKTLEDLNLKVSSLRFPTQRGFDSLENLDRRIDATKSAMLLAYKLGAPVLVNAIGMVPESEDDPRYTTLREVMDDLGRHGARVGAFFAAETGTESGETLSKLLDTCVDGYVAVALNPGQLIVNRFSVPDAVKALRERVQLVCAVDGVIDLAAGRGISVPLGQGIADFPNLIGLLEENRYRGRYVVGRADSTIGELRQSVEYLKNL
ncbi:sugar phosphate isomerase/epimerase family protein [Rubripirellula reticaptiva]|uniref:Xylose isomerase-like TIM barrel n=1 Tax=Rubripirellula reticaptiva TaxID=2528013 RepID=A0A5C6FDA7_9BACT|nr:sugar phosphate isomerase/epimerase family protein [Rubripirellula reticaptiva]TWU58056.1 Xylose isomerase-like TIM barrel [Rubripirellula reticaptiva]